MPHGPLTRLDDNLWTVDSVVPGIPGQSFPRKMTAVRLTDGSLLLHNAVPLDEPTWGQLTALGPIRTLLLPSAFHCLDAHAVAARTGARVVCPAASRASIEEVVGVHGDFTTLPADPTIQLEPLAGVSNGEGVLVVSSAGRLSYVIGDCVLNVKSVPGFWGLVWKLVGFTGGPRAGPVWLKRAVTDRAALRAHLTRLADRPGVVRLIPSHGEVVSGVAVARVLRQVVAGIR
jgi:hypothetical protein